MMFNVVYLSAIEISDFDSMIVGHYCKFVDYVMVPITATLQPHYGLSTQPHYSLIAQGSAPPGPNVAITEAITPINGGVSQWQSNLNTESFSDRKQKRGRQN